MCPKGANGMANSADPDQTAPLGSTLFAHNPSGRKRYGIYNEFKTDTRNRWVVWAVTFFKILQFLDCFNFNNPFDGNCRTFLNVQDQLP